MIIKKGNILFNLDEDIKYMTKWDGKLIRITPSQVNLIIASFQKTFQPEDHLWLFGSRADFEKRGGDIDLYIEVKEYSDATLKAKNDFWSDLQNQLGEQKIDIILKSPTQSLYIYEVARNEGVLLI